MIKFLPPQDGKRLDKAISFLVNKYSETGMNPKPVVFHSLNIAFYLLHYGYGLDLAEAALLHDLIEDSDTNKKDIADEFGNKIADWVEALSFKTSIENKEKQYKEMFSRIKRSGRDTLIIKCADIYSNSFYIHLAESLDKQRFLVAKLKYFLDFSREEIGSEPVWRDLYEQSLAEDSRLNKEIP